MNQPERPKPVWAWFFGDEDYTESWTQLPDAGWSARIDHSSVTMADGSIVLMGGWNPTLYNDVWRSTDKGATWTEMTPPGGADWSERWGHSSVAMPDGSIVLMGGSEGPTGTSMNDVWRSIDNGATWTEMTPGVGAEWAGRYEHSSVVMPDGSIVLMGGIDEGYTYMNDVWRSIDNGKTWTEMTPPGGADWSKRHGHSSVALSDGSIVLMGGYDGSNSYNDVWLSTNNGATWMLQTGSPGSPARLDFSSVAMPDESIVLTGGWTTSIHTNDVWRSIDKGATWTEMTPFRVVGKEGASAVWQYRMVALYLWVVWIASGK